MEQEYIRLIRNSPFMQDGVLQHLTTCFTSEKQLNDGGISGTPFLSGSRGFPLQPYGGEMLSHLEGATPFSLDSCWPLCSMERDCAALGHGGGTPPSLIHASLNPTMLCDPEHYGAIRSDVGIVRANREDTALFIPLTLDAFEVLRISPILGEVLVLQPTWRFLDGLESALSVWLAKEANTFLHIEMRPHNAGGVDHSGHDEIRADAKVLHTLTAGAAAFYQWPLEYVYAVAARDVHMKLRLLVLRFPHFISSLAAVEGSNTGMGYEEGASNEVLDGAAAAYPHISRRCGGHEKLKMDTKSLTAPVELQLRTISSPGDALFAHVALPLSLTDAHRWQLPSPRAYPSDRFLDVFNHVQLIGVVDEIFYATRNTDWPMPWVTLLVVSSSGQGGRRGPSSTPVRARRTVDLRLLPAAVLHRVVVVGQVVEVVGRLVVVPAASLPSGSAGARPQADTQAEYLEANTAMVVMGLEELESLAAGGVRARRKGSKPTPSLAFCDSKCASYVPSTLGNGIKPIQEAYLPPEADGAQLSVELERLASAISLRIWEGVRLALGLEPVPPPACEGALWGTDFLFISLDAVVALLVTLFSAQSVVEEMCGLSLLFIDETATASGFMPGVIRRLRRASASAILEIHTGALSRSRPSFFLPSYEVLREPGRVIMDVPEGRQTFAMKQPKFGQGHPVDNNIKAPLRYPSPYLSVEMQKMCLPYVEIIRGGILNHAHRRTIIAQRVESAPGGTLRLLQDVLCGRPIYSTMTFPKPADRSKGFHLETIDPSFSDGHAAHPHLIEQTVKRVGGQSVPYCTTQSAVCTVREGRELLEKGIVFEFLQHMNVVIRPNINVPQKTAVLYGNSEEDLQTLLQSRGEQWLQLLGMALELPHSETFLTRCNANTATDITDEDAYNLSASVELYWMYTAPQLSKVCGGLLRTYFVAAKSVCGDTVDASMMETLVKLTCAHCHMRTRCTYHYYLSLINTTPSYENLQGTLAKGVGLRPEGATKGPQPRNTYVEATCVFRWLAAGPPITALVDAVAAIGLCDSTLHFFTGHSLLERCVFEVLHLEIHDIFNEMAKKCDDIDLFSPFLHSLDTATRIAPLYHAPEQCSADATRYPFHIDEFVADLEFSGNPYLSLEPEKWKESEIRMSDILSIFELSSQIEKMFGRPQPVSKDWDEMYFYEKIRHLVDKTSDSIISKADWWLPSVAVGMILSVVFLGGPEATSQGLGIALQSASPVIRAPPFSTPIQGPHGEKPENEGDEF